MTSDGVGTVSTTEPPDTSGDLAPMRAGGPSTTPVGCAPYDGVFGLDRAPFDPEPDPRLLYATSRNQHALQFIQLALKQLSPVTLLMGRPGVGKTILVRHLLGLVVRGLQVGVLPAPSEGREEPFGRLLAAFGQPPAASPAEARERFLAFVVRGFDDHRASLLVVDDAHRAAGEDLATLRDLITAGHRGSGPSRPFSPLILLLVGPPELRDRLEAPPLRPLARRVEAATDLFRFFPEETAGYVRHRVAEAGGSTRLFRDDALEAVHARTDGVPRAINALCDACLAAAARGGRRRGSTRRRSGPGWSPSPRAARRRSRRRSRTAGSTSSRSSWG